MPPESWCGYFAASRSTSRPTLLIHSRARSRRSLGGNTAALEPERDVVLDRAIVERRVILKDHAAIGARDRAPACPTTSTVPDVAGYCGVSPAMSRSTVDFPQPDGPRMVMNSIFVRNVLDDERHVLDRREAVVVGLRHVVEQDDRRREPAAPRPAVAPALARWLSFVRHGRVSRLRSDTGTARAGTSTAAGRSRTRAARSR